jgi:hypothetical protein
MNRRFLAERVHEKLRPCRCLAPAVGLFILCSGVSAQENEPALAPGLGLGASVGMNGVGGEENGPISSGVGWELHISAASRRGLYVGGGITLSTHDLSGESTPWQIMSFFVEPRWMFYRLSSTYSPFVAVRGGWVREKVPGRTWELRARGLSYGGGGGVIVRLAPQIALEAGLLFGATNFAAYEFVGDFAWKMCLDELEPGTPLPASVTQCSGSRSIGGAVRLCYPPYFPERTSNCSPPEIPYDGTGRSGTWTRTWIGVSFALGSRS